LRYLILVNFICKPTVNFFSAAAISFPDGYRSSRGNLPPMTRPCRATRPFGPRWLALGLLACFVVAGSSCGARAHSAADARSDECGDRDPGADDILFREDFEQQDFPARWPKHWNEAPGPRTIDGTQYGRSLILFSARGQHESRGGGEWAPYTAPDEGLDSLYLRLHMKLESEFTMGTCEQLKLFSINAGATIEQTYGGAGTPPTGRDKASVTLAVDNDLSLHFYTYQPEQNEGYGQIDPFDTDGEATLEPGRWHEIEVLVQLNTPGRRDGRVRAWLDGRLRGELGHVRFRDVAAVKLRRFEILNYFGGDGPRNTSPRSQGALYDDVLVATGSVCTPRTRQ